LLYSYIEDIEMERFYEISMLLDFYGQLITKRQYEILDMHFNNDYSLGEISEHLKISRQGVYDNIKKGGTLLERYENKLGLVEKYLKQKESAGKLISELSSIDKDKLCNDDREKINGVLNELCKLTD
jgi:uncharacterized protein